MDSSRTWIPLIALLFTTNAFAQTVRISALMVATKSGFSPDTLCAYSLTGPEYVAILSDIAADPSELQGLAQHRQSLAAARISQRDALAELHATPDSADLIASHQTAESTLAAAQTTLTASLVSHSNDLLSTRITSAEISTFIDRAQSLGTPLGSPLIPWELLSVDEQHEFLRATDHLEGGRFNPGSSDAVQSIRVSLGNLSSAALIEFNTRLARFQEIISYMSQWLAGG